MWLFVSLRLYRRQEGHVMGDRVYRRMLGTALVLTLSAIPATAEVLKAEVGVAGMF